MKNAFLILFAAVALLSMGMAWHCSNRVEQISAEASATISRLSAENRELRGALKTSSQRDYRVQNGKAVSGKAGTYYAIYNH